MDYQNNNINKKRICWGSIIAGIFTVMAVFFLLFILGSSLGVSMLSPKSDDIINGAGTTVLIWTVVSIILSLACGAFVTGRLAGVNGLIHGFLVWATSLILSIIIGCMILSSILTMIGGTIGTVTSSTGSLLSGIGSASQNGISGIFDLSKNTLKNFDFKSNANNQQLNQNVIEALKKSDIPALHPDYLSSQFKEVKKEAKNTIKEISINPNNSDKILSDLISHLKTRTENIYQSIDRNDVEKAIANNTNLTPKEAERSVDNIIAMHNQAVQEANNKLNDLQNNLQEAKEQLNTWKEQAKEKADMTVKAIARLSFWSFIALLVGALVSTACGLLGQRTVCRKLENQTTDNEHHNYNH
ncbi:CAP-Gly protein [Commensalibacter sp. M0402]|uniref:TIGR04086 family membrane protein n=1 Tax=Commensalibacter TaxID=1079922 RepID=UPI0018DBFE39|nr:MULTISPECIES: hypothetical protein [Commensalibacter]MBI0082197.1 CAP-Gly protein [Commensalibacter sp. W6292M3]MBI0087910.1 CAP-Gly protein [Commensalibacter melissae]